MREGQGEAEGMGCERRGGRVRERVVEFCAGFVQGVECVEECGGVG